MQCTLSGRKDAQLAVARFLVRHLPDGTASITDAGGGADISRWCKPPVPPTKYREPREGDEMTSSDFLRPGWGSDSIFTMNRWLAPPANLQLSLRDASALRSSRGRGAKQLPSHREAETLRVLELRFSTVLVRPSKA